MHTATTTNVTTIIRIKIMVTPIDTPTTVPIDPAFVVCEGVLVAMELILLVAVDELAVGLSVNGIESVIWGTR